MPELDLSQALELRVANQDVLAVRIANVDVWNAPNAFASFNVFGNEPPISAQFPGYAVGTDLGIGGWTGSAFYSFGSGYDSAVIAGLRLWVPSGSEIVGESVKIGLFQTPEGNGVSWVGYQPSDVMEGLATSDALKTFPNGTLVAGWNNLYFDTTWPLINATYFVVGVSIGDGSKYLYGEETDGAAFEARSGARLALSEDHQGLHRGMYRAGSDSATGSSWSTGHYGLDIIVRVPILSSLYDSSIWIDEEPNAEAYYSYDGLGTNGWTTSHFYSSGPSPEEGWSLVGARIWIPPAERDPKAVIGEMAQCGYYVKPSGAITNGEDTAADIINAVKANTLNPIELTAGWNSVYFPEPVELPWGAGIAIGWKIGDGDEYVARGLVSNSIKSLDPVPFYLAASADGAGERRGAYIENGVANWAFATNHYGGDIIVRQPGK